MKGHGRALLRRRRPGLALITVRQRHDVPGFAGAVQHHVVGEDVGVLIFSSSTIAKIGDFSMILGLQP
ncbi:hypothetical protein OPV22_031475 [Ensete ventricosum]|uniref:Uncharacterized protein n=1 Tax=Ensete ventricosum TaxID=4639 RepID=A0AAV8PWL7_ENSVE|nr:hypothetical protein OPV22_031475 [Ensete ventricosum]